MQMIVYNVTLKAETDIAEEWLKWMQEVHIPEVMATACFLRYRLFHLRLEEQDGISFCVQYEAEADDNLHDYFENFAPEMQQKHHDKYGERVVAFRTLLELIG